MRRRAGNGGNDGTYNYSLLTTRRKNHGRFGNRIYQQHETAIPVVWYRLSDLLSVLRLLPLQNTSGITYPFFVIGTLCCFFFSMKKLGVPFKKDSVFYIMGIVLLGISNCLTASLPVLFMNKCGIFTFFL